MLDVLPDFLFGENCRDGAGMAGFMLRIAPILALAWSALRIARKRIRTLRVYLSRLRDPPHESKRIETLGRVFRHVASVVISVIAGPFFLEERRVATGPILGAAGVTGIVLGFGARSLIKDGFNRFCLAIENQLRQGDAIEASVMAGFVEKVTLRFVRQRDSTATCIYCSTALFPP